MHSKDQPVEVGWCIYVSVNLVIIGSVNSLFPGEWQGISWTITDLIGLSGKKQLQRNMNENFFKNGIENVDWKISVKSFMPYDDISIKPLP